MKNVRGVSLPQLPNEIVRNARKTRLDSFAVALEGWRRGLKLKWYTKDSEHFKDMIIFGVNPPGRLFSLSSDERTHYFFRTRGDKVTNEAVELASDKGVTKEILAQKNVPVPKGKGFSADTSDKEIIEFSRTLGYPLVCKPTDASLGAGVVTNIKNDEEFVRALEYVRHELDYDDVIVEQHVTGPEYRLYVIDNKVVAAYNRIPANITGDGVHTIEELIELKNYERRQNARLNSCLIHIDNEIIEFINKKGYDLTSVPKRDEYIPLREKTNVSIGGDPIDVTDEISEEVKQIAVNAINAIPGLYHAGVDIMINEGSNIDAPAVVLEINATAQIGGILYPLRGKARDIPKAIIDYYFPETKGIDTTNSKIYFDMSTVLEPMENRSALEVEVQDAPLGELYARRYVVSGVVDKEHYHRWLKLRALERNLHGYVKTLVFDEIEVVVSGTDKQVVNEFRNVIRNYDRGVRVRRIRSEKWDEPVTVGFDILEMFQATNARSAQHLLRKLEKEQIRLARQNERVEKDIQHILNSTSWRITAPIRKVLKND
ncbi:MAG TPA: acylphosphatase [Pseudogracilibacillus sp.]|nr:acylphosphatase [Pseudogracilibacillus sp.]